ncbi:bacillithiol biosynthesis cysteine-adding enzyme BshC [Heliobacterium undosum]|uniref:Putative cysteine ligase BshC n=1 Tax=Heliomicrobium undosum TaxID=121734 RepID=A0A845L1P5_9FIRM|nr:bacillithiol biosynthesis cysteine-adding enzyme BshC [Heliomicrobium undosum]MZP28724.1 bacillithiol biosynthesis cysteine-adding enzyme BshC [Heliomicrobium undosum]
MSFERTGSIFSGLAGAYIQREAHVVSLFPYAFPDEEALALRASRIAVTDPSTTNPYPRSELSALLEAYQRRLAELAGLEGAFNRAADQARRLAEADSLAVVTGQQAGLFTGPLYTVYKAVTCINLAKRLEEKTGRPVVPVFWVASEDHDFEEISHIELLQGEKAVPVTVTSRPEEDRFAVGHRTLPEDLAATLEGFLSLLPQSEHRPPWEETWHRLLTSPAGPHEHFAALLHRLLGPYGLVILDPLLPGLKQLPGCASFFASVLENEVALREGLSRGVEQIRELGYTPQVEKGPEETNLFYFHQGRRLAIVHDGGGYRLRGAEIAFSRDELLDLARRRPDLFSANVVTRPLLQDRLLPTAAYVAGPGEIAYFAAYRDVYSAMGMEMPPIVPRLSATIIEGFVDKLLERYALSFADVPAELEGRLKEELAAQDELGIEALFEELESRVRSAYLPAVERIARWDRQTEKLAEENLDRVIAQARFLRQKVEHRHRQRCQDTRNHFRKLELHLWPTAPQERVYNIFPYLLKYGSSLIETLLEAPVEWLDSHCLIRC